MYMQHNVIRGYKFRQDTAKEQTQKEIHVEEIKQKQTELKRTVVALEDTKVALEQTQKQYIELTVQLSRTQIITSAVAVGLVGMTFQENSFDIPQIYVLQLLHI